MVLMPDYFTVVRTLGASKEQVFDVITLPKHFAVWFGTAVVEVPLEALRMEVWPGGQFRAEMKLPEGGAINWAGTYIAVERPSHVAMTLTDQPGSDAGLPVLFDIEEVGGATQLTISQDRSDFSDDQIAATIAGYNAFVDDIEEILQSSAQENAQSS